FLTFSSFLQTNECTESVAATATTVLSCPSNAKEWDERSLKKGCSQIKHTCRSFKYHCVVNSWLNETIEVCAPVRIIVGKTCAEYNSGGKTIQRNLKVDCKECPDVYSSVKSFLYQKCYKHVQNNMASQNIPTLPPNPSKSKLPPSTLCNIEILSSENPLKSNEGTYIIPIVVIISAIVVIIAVIAVCQSIRIHNLRQEMFDNDLDPTKTFQNPQKVKTDRESRSAIGDTDVILLENMKYPWGLYLTENTD
ncbi:uncharacterized protein LOC144620906, partial [Crassostrea virginica]